MQKFWNILLYFSIAILLIGTMGIWLPPILEYYDTGEFSKINIIQNSTTYFISIIVAGCLELTSHIIKSSSVKNKLGIIFLLILIILIAVGAVICNSILINAKNITFSKYIVIFMILISWTLWWISNWRKNDMDPSNAIGGEL